VRFQGSLSLSLEERPKKTVWKEVYNGHTPFCVNGLVQGSRQLEMFREETFSAFVVLWTFWYTRPRLILLASLLFNRFALSERWRELVTRQERSRQRARVL